MELELRVADTLSLYREKQEKWWENVIELGAKVWLIRITDSRNKLQNSNKSRIEKCNFLIAKLIWIIENT